MFQWNKLHNRTRWKLCCRSLFRDTGDTNSEEPNHTVTKKPSGPKSNSTENPIDQACLQFRLRRMWFSWWPVSAILFLAIHKCLDHYILKLKSWYCSPCWYSSTIDVDHLWCCPDPWTLSLRWMFLLRLSWTILLFIKFDGLTIIDSLTNWHIYCPHI